MKIYKTSKKVEINKARKQIGKITERFQCAKAPKHQDMPFNVRTKTYLKQTTMPQRHLTSLGSKLASLWGVGIEHR